MVRLLLGIVCFWVTPLLATDSVAQPSAPTITAIRPTSGSAGQTVTVTVNGNNFTPDMKFGLGPGITVSAQKFVGTTTATMTLTINASAAGGARDLTASNGFATSMLHNAFIVSGSPPAPAPKSGGNSGATNLAPSSREVSANSPQTVVAPTITMISPTSGAAGERVNVTIKGNNFTPATKFSLGPGIKVSAQKFVSATTATMTLTINASAPSSVRDLTASNGAASSVLAKAFVIHPGRRVRD